MGPLNPAKIFASAPIQIPPRRTASSETLDDSPMTRQTCPVLTRRPQGPFAPQPAHPALCHGTFGAQELFRCVVGLDYASQEKTINGMEARGWHLVTNNFEGAWNRLITFSRPLQAPYGVKQEVCTKSVFAAYWVDTAATMNEQGWSYDGMVEQTANRYLLTFSRVSPARPPRMDLPEPSAVAAK